MFTSDASKFVIVELLVLLMVLPEPFTRPDAKLPRIELFSLLPFRL